MYVNVFWNHESLFKDVLERFSFTYMHILSLVLCQQYVKISRTSRNITHYYGPWEYNHRMLSLNMSFLAQSFTSHDYIHRAHITNSQRWVMLCTLWLVVDHLPYASLLGSGSTSMWVYQEDEHFLRMVKLIGRHFLFCK